MTGFKYPKGSEWRKWDLHVHSPYSYGGDYKVFISNLEKSEADVIGINDYCSVFGYEEILKANSINKILFPIIEFRMNNIILDKDDPRANKGARINFHIIFNNAINISYIIHSARATAVRQINKTQVLAYYEIGREIVEFEQKGKARAGYGEELIKRLSKDMTIKFGRGFLERNMRNIRAFYLSFPIQQTVSAKSLKSETASVKPSIRQTPSDEFEPVLSWSHYCELLSVEYPLARSFYEKEAVHNNWSFRELKRQINSQLFERLALSKDSSAVVRLAKKGHLIETPEDAIKDPYVLEFLNLKEENVYTESHFEQSIMDNLQKFLLEMGKGFTFVARQKRITVGNRHYYIDLVFYNRILKCIILIDLKIDELNHSDIGQMNFYLNYFKENEKEAGENDPIGLILCAKKDEVFAKYVLGNLNNKIFASKYKLALPTEKELSRKIRSLHLLEGRDET